MSATALAVSSRIDKARVSEQIKEAVREAVLDILMSGHRIGEKYDIKVKPGFKTASWSYRPPHCIYVGDGIPEKAKPELTDAEMVQYFMKYVFHEFGHLLWTERNLKKVDTALQSIKVPFSLFNLFEDARIEHRYRDGKSTFFEWTKYEPIHWETKPLAIFFALVQYEGDIESVRQEVLKLLESTSTDEDRTELNETIDKVAQYYQRCLDAKSSQDLYPVLKDWMLEYPPGKSHIPSRGNEFGAGEGTPDLTPMLEGQAAEEAAALFDAGSFSVTGEKDKTLKGASAPGKPMGEMPDGGNDDLLSDEDQELDEQRVAAVTTRLGNLFTSTTRVVTLDRPGRKISIRHYVTDRPFYRHRELESIGRSKVLLVVDCSGSMSGLHIEEGRVLVAALSQLARRGIVSGHVVLSAVKGDRAIWQRFALPMKTEQIRRIHAFGSAEGLEASIRNNMKLAQEADFVFVYTDAQICDKPVDKAKLHLQGVYTWGLYAGEREVLDELKKYFDKAIMRENVERLVEAMLIK